MPASVIHCRNVLGERDVTQFDQLLARQRRAKIEIAFADQV